VICVHWSSPLEVRKKNNGNELITITVDTINYENCKKKKIHLQCFAISETKFKIIWCYFEIGGTAG